MPTASTDHSKRAKGVVKRLTSIQHGGVNPRSRAVRKTTSATPSAARTSRNTANMRMERRLIRDMVRTFIDLGDCSLLGEYANSKGKYAIDYPESYMDAVDTVLRLKQFYIEKRRKGIRYAVIESRTSTPLTFKQILEHVNYIFRTARTFNVNDGETLDEQFRYHGYHYMGFDQKYSVPLCHLQGFQMSSSYARMTRRERKRFIEARRWLEERTPILVMDFISWKRPYKDEHLTRMFPLDTFNNVTLSKLPPLTNTPVLMRRPGGSVLVPKRSRGRAPVPYGKRR